MTIENDPVALIRAHDPAFDPERFITYAEWAWREVHHARAEGHPERSRGIMIPQLYDAQKAAVPTAGPVTPGPTVNGRVVGAVSGAGADAITVRFSSSQPPMMELEDWTFQRPAGVRTQPLQAAVSRCPGCGAPRRPGDGDVCHYCGAHIYTGSWLLVRTHLADPMVLSGTVDVNKIFADTLAKAFTGDTEGLRQNMEKVGRAVGAVDEFGRSPTDSAGPGQRIGCVVIAVIVVLLFMVVAFGHR